MNEEDKEEIGESLDFSKPDFEFKPKEYHEWRQRGNYLVCTSCELEHAVHIGMNKLLVGLSDDGRPILVDREIYRLKGYNKAYEEAKERLQRNK